MESTYTLSYDGRSRFLRVRDASGQIVREFTGAKADCFQKAEEWIAAQQTQDDEK